jgi:hypothetical protein
MISPAKQPGFFMGLALDLYFSPHDEMDRDIYGSMACDQLQ